MLCSSCTHLLGPLLFVPKNVLLIVLNNTFMLNLLKVALIIFLAVVILRYLGKHLLSFMIRRLIKRYAGFQEPTSSRREGEVHIKDKPHKEKLVENDVGEYVDFEEMK